MPEGTRLQLDPNATEQQINQWCGQDPACRVIVRAMQEYGMFVMENSGHPKLFVEDKETALWNGRVTFDTVRNIPYEAFHVLDWNAGR